MSDLIDYANDLKDEDIEGLPAPSDFAPDSSNPIAACGAVYDEKDDPEMNPPGQKIRVVERLTEALTKDVATFVNNSDDLSYNAWLQSELASKNKMIPENVYVRLAHEAVEMRGAKPKTALPSKFTRSGGQSNSKKPGPYAKPDEYVPGEYEKDVAELSKKYGTMSLDKSADEIFEEVFNAVRDVISGHEDQKPHAIIFGDPGIGKTFEVQKVCQNYLHESPTSAKLVEVAGAIGKSESSLVPFFYKYSQNYIILFDDCDTMVMENQSNDIRNLMKGILDINAKTSKPVNVNINMRRQYNKIYKQLVTDESAEDNRKSAREGRIFEVDVEALRENRLVVAINDVIAIDKLIPLNEAQDLQNRIIPIKEKENKYENIYAKSLREYSRINEADDDDEDYEDDDDLLDTESQNVDDGEFPSKFLFNSKVIFISNLELNQINDAVLDRATAVEVKLTCEQFLERLGKIYGGLAKMSHDSMVNPTVREWSKKNVYTVIQIAIEAWKSGMPIFGAPVEINRNLTFRMFNEFVSAWERLARSYAEKKDRKKLDGSDRAYLDRISKLLVPEMFRLKVIPYLAISTRG